MLRTINKNILIQKTQLLDGVNVLAASCFPSIDPKNGKKSKATNNSCCKAAMAVNDNNYC
jgi:hypothetical protein